jgi:hypothetical protein
MYKLIIGPILTQPSINHHVTGSNIIQASGVNNQAISGLKSARHAAAMVEADAILSRHLSHHQRIHMAPGFCHPLKISNNKSQWPNPDKPEKWPQRPEDTKKNCLLKSIFVFWCLGG